MCGCHCQGNGREMEGQLCGDSVRIVNVVKIMSRIGWDWRVEGGVGR